MFDNFVFEIIKTKQNYNKHKNSIRDARTPQPGEIISTPSDIEVVQQYKDGDTFRALSVI